MSPVEAQVIMAQLTAIRDDVLEVKAKVSETNGRVKALELWQARVDGFRRGVGFSFQWLPVVVGSVISAVVVGVIAALTPLL